MSDRMGAGAAIIAGSIWAGSALIGGGYSTNQGPQGNLDVVEGHLSESSATMPKGPSAKYLARARAFAQAVDLGIELYATLPAHERDAMERGSLEWKKMALAPEPPFASLQSLAYLEDAFFTYWNEASGEHIERFWQRVTAGGLPFERKDVVRDVLSRGRIRNDIEYQTITDSIVIHQQMGKISRAEADRLSEMLGQFEKRAGARK